MATERATPEIDDDALLDEVRAMLRRLDAPPGALLDGARDLLAWRSFDAALNALLCAEEAPPR